MHDWIKMSHVKAGDQVELDGGFTCHAPGVVTIKEDEYGKYFECSHGNHYLTGQLGVDNDTCIGMYEVRTKKNPTNP